jgi:drug/metabolite transporter (DMT)-like permease
VQALALLIWLGPQMGVGLVRTRHLHLHLVRAALLPCSSVCFFMSLKYLPLAEATAINYSTPVLVVILAVVFLKERMTQARIALVIAGIAGMFLIVRPGSTMFQEAALLSLGAAFFYGWYQILTRMLASEDWRVLLFYPALVGMLGMTAILRGTASGPRCRGRISRSSSAARCSAPSAISFSSLRSSERRRPRSRHLPMCTSSGRRSSGGWFSAHCPTHGRSQGWR